MQRKQNNGLFSDFVVDLIVPFVTTIVFFIAVYVCFGFYWGWIDDVYFNGVLSGRYYGEPLTSLFTRVVVFWPDAIVSLSSTFPKLNWYGVMLYTYLFISCWLINLAANAFLRRSGVSFLNRLLLLLAFNLVAMGELTYMITFTSVAIISVGTAFATLKRSKSKICWLLILPFLLSGLAIRPEAAALLSPLFLASSIKSKGSRKLSMILLAMFIGLSPFIAEKLNYNEDAKEFQKYHFALQNILDGQNSESFDRLVKQDSARTLALFSWYTGDLDSLLSSNYIKLLNPRSPVSIENLQRAPSKLKGEINKAKSRYSENYTPSRNWFKKATISVCFLVAFYLIVGRGQHKRFQLTLISVFLITILATSILFKMEYRLFYPGLIITFLLSLPDMRLRRMGPLVKSGALLLILFMLADRISEYRLTSEDLSRENTAKETFQSNLGHYFTNKILLFDFLTMSFHSPPIFDSASAKSKGSNTHVVYGEFFSNFSKRHRSYLKELCGSAALVPFFYCLLERKNDVVFILTPIRVEMYKLYFKDVYGLDISFKSLDADQKPKENTMYSFVWEEIEYDYYMLSDLRPTQKQLD